MSSKSSLAGLIWSMGWLGLRYKKSAYKVLAKAGRAPDAPFRADFFGLKYEGNLKNNIEFSIYFYGAFEKPLLFFLRDALASLANASAHKSPSCFCDIGANIGQHSLYMSQFAAAVHAFEPFDEVSKKLEHQVSLNAIENISLHKVGLSDISEKLTFYAPTGSNQGIGSFDANTVSKGNEALGELSLKNGDELFTELAIEQVDLIKIDVEGFEKRTLKGLRQTLTQQRPIIVCELSYGAELSFNSREEFIATMPEDYEFFVFDIRKPDGSKARRRGAKAKRSGYYRLIPHRGWHDKGQDDIVACPKEKVELLPRESQASF
ncbi:MAG: FkbM family methyltransferase [Pseudohongiellaceae bacterium]|jgi:FkbM family methyltransferase